MARKCKSGEGEERFQKAWLSSLMDNLKTSIPAAQFDRVMECCGRDCARRDAAGMIASAKGDVEALLTSFARSMGAKNASREGDKYHLRYPRCYCPVVKDGPARLPDAYCECGRGFIAEVFSSVAGKPVPVRLVESIRRGGTQCHFVIRA
jgi:predicted hydrocarbon binding protein